MIRLKIFSDNQAGMNSYLLYDESKACLIDPGFNGKEVIAFLKAKNLKLDTVILTHGHFDHICDLTLLDHEYDFRVYLHESDLIIINNNDYNYANFFNRSQFFVPRNLEIITAKDQSEIDFGNAKLKVLWTPGHTEGSICIKYNNMLFSGDTLFADSIGRTDLFSGSMNKINKSLKKLNELISNNVMVYPGHGKKALMSDVRKQNQYL